MAAETEDLEICQGSLFEIEFTYRDGNGFGIDLATAVVRMQIRTPDRNAATAVFNVTSAGATALGSTLAITPSARITATAITTFAADGVVTATGAGFEQTITRVTEFDEVTGKPLGLEDVLEAVANIGDLVTIAGSTSNDGSYRINSVTDENIAVLRPAPTEEAAAGTLAVDSHGEFILSITAEESDSWTFNKGEYDIEIVETGGAQPVRLMQGRVKLDKNATKA